MQVYVLLESLLTVQKIISRSSGHVQSSEGEVNRHRLGGYSEQSGHQLHVKQWRMACRHLHKCTANTPRRNAM